MTSSCSDVCAKSTPNVKFTWTNYSSTEWKKQWNLYGGVLVSECYHHIDLSFCHYYYFAKFILQSIVLTLVFGVCLSLCVCVCVCVSKNFLLYSITKTILPGSSPHLVRTFLTSIPLFLLILGSFRKTRWPPCLFFYSIFSHWLSIGH